MDQEFLTLDDLLGIITFSAFSARTLSVFFQQNFGLSEEYRSLLAVSIFTAALQEAFA